MSSVRVIGRGRAGRSLATALGRAGWGLGGVLGRADEVDEAAAGVDLLVIAVPDDAVATVASTVAPVQTTVVAHMAGSLGLDVLAPHARRAALFRFETEEASRGADIENRLSGYVDAADVILEAPAQIPMGRDQAEPRQFHRVIKKTIFETIDESRSSEVHGSIGRGRRFIHHSNNTNEIPVTNSPCTTDPG